MYLELYLINPEPGNFIILKSMRQMLFIQKTQIYHIYDAINLIHAELCVNECTQPPSLHSLGSETATLNPSYQSNMSLKSY